LKEVRGGRGVFGITGMNINTPLPPLKGGI